MGARGRPLRYSVNRPGAAAVRKPARTEAQREVTGRRRGPGGGAWRGSSPGGALEGREEVGWLGRRRGGRGSVGRHGRLLPAVGKEGRRRRLGASGRTRAEEVVGERGEHEGVGIERSPGDGGWFRVREGWEMVG